MNYINDTQQSLDTCLLSNTKFLHLTPNIFTQPRQYMIAEHNVLVLLNIYTLLEC